MAQESCKLDKDEAEVLKPKPSSSASSSPPPPASSPPSLVFKSAEDSLIQTPETPASSPANPDGAVSCTRKRGEESQPSVRFGNRCLNCRKRVGLTGFRCRCGDLFCSRHRYSGDHNCSFDYKAAGREQISKDNPLIKPAKIIKI